MSNIEVEELLAKLNEVNRSLQMDCKSVHSLSLYYRTDSVDNELYTYSFTDDDKISLSSVTGINSEMGNPVLEKWNNVITNWQDSNRRRNQVRELIKQSCGVPYQLRPIVWQLLCGSNDHNSQMNKQKILYPEYLKKQSPCESAIRRDITRTFPQHPFFKDQNSDGQMGLFNIMKAYSILDREVGYCQGSGFIGGLLLLQMPEEDAFAVLVSLLFEHQLRKLYKPSMSELELCMHQLDLLVEEYLPKLYSHFQSHNFTASVYASGWFLTLFTLPFSTDLANMVMDLFILDGIEIIFKISLAYLTMFQNELLTMDMESMLRFLQSVGPLIVEEEPSKLFEIMFQIRLNTRKMKKVEKKFLALKTEEEAHQIELRRLRTENGLLLQRIDHLEKEIQQLTQRLEMRNIIRNDSTQEVKEIKSDLRESNRNIDHVRGNHNDKYQQTEIFNVINQTRENTQEGLHRPPILASGPTINECYSSCLIMNGENQDIYKESGMGENVGSQLISQRDEEIVVLKELLKESQCIQRSLLFELDEANKKIGNIEFQDKNEFLLWEKEKHTANFTIDNQMNIQSRYKKEDLGLNSNQYVASAATNQCDNVDSVTYNGNSLTICDSAKTFGIKSSERWIPHSKDLKDSDLEIAKE